MAEDGGGENIVITETSLCIKSKVTYYFKVHLVKKIKRTIAVDTI